MRRAFNAFMFDRMDAPLLDGTGLRPDPELAARNLERAKEAINKMGEKWCAHRSNAPVGRKKEFWIGQAQELIDMMPRSKPALDDLYRWAAEDEMQTLAAHSHTEQ